MSEIKSGEIRLTKGESERFKNSMIHLDMDSIKIRDAFINDNNNGTITINSDGSGTITITHSKIIPISNPNYYMQETPEELLDIVNELPIFITDVDLSNVELSEKIPEEHIIGVTIPNTATLRLCYINADIVWKDKKYGNNYCYKNAIIKVDSNLLNIKGIEYVEYADAIDCELDGKEKGGRYEI